MVIYIFIDWFTIDGGWWQKNIINISIVISHSIEKVSFWVIQVIYDLKDNDHSISLGEI